MGLQWKAGLYGGVGLLILVGILAFLGVQAVDKSTRRSLEERVLTAQTTAQSVDHFLRGTLEGLAQFASIQANDMEEPGTAAESQALDSFFRWSGNLSMALLLDRDGRVVHTQPLRPEWTGMVYATDPALLDALSDPRPRVVSASGGPGGDARVFALVAPMTGTTGAVVGWAVGLVDLANTEAAGIISPARLGSTAYVQLVDEGGWVMAETGSPKLSQEMEQTEYAAHFANLVRAGVPAQETCYRCHQTGAGVQRRRDVLAFAPLTVVAGGVAIRQHEEEALAPSRELTRDLLLSGAVVFGLGVSMIWLATRGLVHPLVQLTAAARRLARGEFGVQVTSNRRDELGELAGTFDLMRLSLSESLRQKEERARESEMRAQQLAALNALADSVSRSLDLDRVLQDGLEQAVRVAGAEAGAVWLREGDPPQMVLKVHRGAALEWLERMPRLQPDTGMEVVVAPIPTAGHPSPQEPFSFVQVPLATRGQVLGVMALVRRAGAPLEQQERELLTAFGQGLGVGVENAQLFLESRRREQEARALYRIGVEVSLLLELDRTLETVVESARGLLEMDAAILSLREETTGATITRAVSGPLNHRFKALQVPPGRGLAGLVMGEGAPVASEDLANDPRIPHHPEEDDLFRADGIRSVLAVPIKIGAEVSGSLAVANRRIQRFHDREVDLLQQLASQAAVAVENARLHDQVEEVAVLQERQRIAREMHDGLGQVLAYLGLKSREVDSLVAAGRADEAREGLGEVKRVVENAYQDVRDAVLSLRTPVAPRASIVALLEPYLEGFRQQAGIPVIVAVADDRAIHFPPGVAIQLVRVVQEALANVRKHARAGRAAVRFESAGGEAVIAVEDDGVGFDPGAERLGPPFHFGLQVMRERVESVGGTLSVRSSPGAGTLVEARMPLAAGDGGYHGAAAGAAGR